MLPTRYFLGSVNLTITRSLTSRRMTRIFVLQHPLIKITLFRLTSILHHLMKKPDLCFIENILKSVDKNRPVPFKFKKKKEN